MKLVDEVDLNSLTAKGQYWANNINVTGLPTTFPSTCDTLAVDVDTVDTGASNKVKQTIITMDRDTGTSHNRVWSRVGEYTTPNASDLLWTAFVEVLNENSITGAASTITKDNLANNKLIGSNGSGKVVVTPFGYSATAITPDTTNAVDIGTQSLYFQGGHFQYVNFMSAEDVNEGNLDADAGSLGLFGVNELALGYGNNNKDLTFTVSGLTLSKNLLVKNGNRITFQDGDTSSPEEVSMQMEGNDLTFYGKANNNAEVEVARLTYDGNFSVNNNIVAKNDISAVGNITGSNTTKVYSIYQQVTATAANITMVNNDQVEVLFIGTNVGGSNWFEVRNKSGVSSQMIWSSITDGVSASGSLNQTSNGKLTVASPTSTSGERTISIYIVGRNSTGNGLKGVVVDIAMKWASTSYAVGVVRVSGAY